MKIKIVALALTTAALGYNGLACAADGTINFTGMIADNVCTVDTASATQTVNLGNVSVNALASAGTTASPTRFTLTLKNCPDTVKTAQTRFDGTPASGNSSILALNTPADGTMTAAKNVGVAIYEQDSSTLVPLGTPSKDTKISSTADNTLTYIAKYYATGTPVSAGLADATATFTITYN